MHAHTTIPHARQVPMNKVVALVTTTVGSSIGWWAGAHVGIMTAFCVSMVGFGAGMWGARRIVDHLGL